MIPDTTPTTLEEPYSMLFLAIIIVTMIISAVIAFRDYKTMTVPLFLSVLLPGIFFVSYVLIILFWDYSARIIITPGLSIIPVHGLIAGLILGSITAGIIVLTRQKAMGTGDIPFMMLLGLAGGFEKTILALYITVFTALIYGLIKGFQQKKWRGMRIPFIPFIVAGITISLILGDNALYSVLSLLTQLV